MADIYFHPIATTTIYFPTPGIDVPEYECFAAPRSVGSERCLGCDSSTVEFGVRHRAAARPLSAAHLPWGFHM